MQQHLLKCSHCPVILFHSVVLTHFNVDCTILLIDCDLSAPSRYILWSLNLMSKPGTKCNLCTFFFFVSFFFLPSYMAILSESACVLVYAFGLWFSFLWRLKCSFVSSSGWVVWALQFMYLVTFLKCLALLQWRFCSFACFTNAS